MSLAPPKTAESERIPAANRRAWHRDRARRLAQRGIAATQRPVGVGCGFAHAAPLHAAFAGLRPACSPSPLDAPCRQRRGVYIGSTDSVMSGGSCPCAAPIVAPAARFPLTRARRNSREPRNALSIP